MILRLPDDALVRTTPEIRARLRQLAEWPIQVELIAQLIEEVSIVASELRRQKPREVPRPDHLKAPAATPEEGIKHAVSVFARTAQRRPRP